MPCDGKSQSNNFSFIVSKSKLGGSNSVNLHTIKLELFHELIVVAVRLGSELLFSEQNPFCATVFAQHLPQSSPAMWLRTLRSYCSTTKTATGVRERRLRPKDIYGSFSEHISKHFINWDTLHCGSQCSKSVANLEVRVPQRKRFRCSPSLVFTLLTY